MLQINNVNYGVASFLSLSKSICNLETTITRIIGSSTTTSFHRWTPSMNMDKLIGTHYVPLPSPLPKTSPWIPTWLVQNIKYVLFLIPRYDWVEHMW